MPNGVDFIVTDRANFAVCTYCYQSQKNGSKVIAFGAEIICPDCVKIICDLAKKHELGVTVYTCKKCGTYKDDNHGRFLVHTRTCKGEGIA